MYGFAIDESNNQEKIMKAKITLNTNGTVTLYCDQPDWSLADGRIATTYFCPGSGGYVRIADGKNYPQVCDKLSSSGSTLTCESSGEPLLRMIRREYQSLQRAENRRLAAY